MNTMLLLKIYAPLALIGVLVWLARGGSPARALERAGERLRAAGSLAREAPGALGRGAWNVLLLSWWARLAAALAALVLARPGGEKLLMLAAASLSVLLVAWALLRVPLVGHMLRPVATGLTTLAGVITALYVVGLGAEVGGWWGWSAAALGGWAVWGAIQNRTLARAAEESGFGAERVIEVREVREEGGGDV